MIDNGLPEGAGAGVAVLVVGAAAAVSSTALRVQLDSITTAGIVSVLPGLLTYQGITQLGLRQHSR